MRNPGPVISRASEAVMKAMLAALLTLSLLAGLADEASAATQRKHKSKYKAYSNRQADPKSVPNGAADPSQPGIRTTPSLLPFGSQLWWRQKEREKRRQHRD